MPTLVVQMGHCYRTTGATGTTGEQAFTSAVGDACVRLLNGRDGWTVRKILADAPSTDYRGDAFVAVHCDGSTSTTARGASVGYRTPEGQALGQAWKRAYAARGWEGFRVDNYTTALAQYYGTGTAVAQGTRRSIIVESGFLTNPEDRAVLHAAGGPARVALAIGDALGIATPVQEEDDDMSVYDSIPAKPDGTGATSVAIEAQWAAHNFRTVNAGIKALTELVASKNGVTADQVAQALAPLILPTLTEHIDKLDDGQLAESAQAIADEIDRRAQVRANTEV